MRQRIVIAGNYVTPKANAYKPLSWLMREWNFGAYLTYASGFPIMAPMAANAPFPMQRLFGIRQRGPILVQANTAGLLITVTTAPVAFRPKI